MRTSSTCLQDQVRDAAVRPAVRRILDKLDTPAILRGAHADYVAANRLGRALYAPLFGSHEQPPNSARFCFLDPAAQDFYVDWARVASELVAHLRSEAGRNPYDRGLTDLVGELVGDVGCRPVGRPRGARRTPRLATRRLAPADNRSSTWSSARAEEGARRGRRRPRIEPLGLLKLATPRRTLSIGQEERWNRYDWAAPG